MANKTLVTIAVMSVFFLTMGVGTVTPAIQSVAEAFPELSFSTILLVSTLPSLFIIPSTYISGMVAGNKIGYRPLLLIGILLFSLAGAAPYILTASFAVILVARAIFGIGLGIISPLGNALILSLYEGQERANMLGLSGVVMNLGGIALQLLGGILAAIRWNYAFLAHLLGIVSLLMVMFMLPEPEKREEEKVQEKIVIPGSVYLISLLFGIAIMANYPLLVNMSTIISTSNLGDAASAGVVLSMFTVGGMIAGAIFGKVYQLATRFTISIGLLIMAVGSGIVHYANTLMVLTVGTTLVGIGFGLVMPAVMMILGSQVAPNAFAAASGILMAFMNLGGFMSTYYIAMLAGINSAVRFPIFVAMCLYGLSGIVYGLLQTKNTPSIAAKS